MRPACMQHLRRYLIILARCLQARRADPIAMTDRARGGWVQVPEVGAKAYRGLGSHAPPPPQRLAQGATPPWQVRPHVDPVSHVVLLRRPLCCSTACEQSGTQGMPPAHTLGAQEQCTVIHSVCTVSMSWALQHRALLAGCIQALLPLHEAWLPGLAREH